MLRLLAPPRVLRTARRERGVRGHLCVVCVLRKHGVVVVVHGHTSLLDDRGWISMVWIRPTQRHMLMGNTVWRWHKVCEDPKDVITDVVAESEKEPQKDPKGF